MQLTADFRFIKVQQLLYQRSGISGVVAGPGPGLGLGGCRFFFMFACCDVFDVPDE
jgi:hypothetical protein